jgi:hypothetical protein
MCYKSIVNKLDKFLAEKSACEGCPLYASEADSSFADKLITEFSIKSDCVINFFYNIKEILPEDKINFLLEKLKENNIRNVNCCDYEEGSSRFIKVLKSIISTELEIE